MAAKRHTEQEVLTFSVKNRSLSTVRRHYEKWRHKNGNSLDNRPDNLRFLCPNCDSQLTETRGGRNKGRIQDLNENGFHVKYRNGRQDALVSLTGVGARGYVGNLKSKSNEKK
jgi:hypothetical protein